MANENYRELLSLNCLNSSQDFDQSDLMGKLVVLISFRETNILSLCYLEKMKQWADHYKKHMIVVGLFSPKFEQEDDDTYIKSVISRYNLKFPVFKDKGHFFRKIFGLKVEPGLVVFDQLGRRRSIGSGNFDLKAVHDLALSLMNQAMKSKITKSVNSILIEQPEDRGGFMWGPTALAYDSTRNLIYLCDSFHHRIIAATADGRVEFVVGTGEAGDLDGDQRSCQFFYPKSLYVLDDVLYIGDTGNHKIKAMSLSTGIVKTVIGTGQLNFHQAVAHRGNRISLSYPMGLSHVEIEGTKYLLFSNTASRGILKFDIEKDEVSNYIGNGVDKFVDEHRNSSSFKQPTGILSTIPGFHFILDSDHSALRIVHKEYVKTIVGNKEGEFGEVNASLADARMNYPTEMAWDRGDKIFIVDYFSSSLRTYSLKDKELNEIKLSLPEHAKLFGISYYKDKQFILSDSYNNKLYLFHSETLELKAIDLRFNSSNQEEIKEKVGKLPQPKYLIEEKTEKRRSLLSASVVLEIELPEAYIINEEATSTLSVFEKHVSHWYLVRRIDISNKTKSFKLHLRNVARTDHYIIDVKLSICREGVSYESKEHSFRLHLQEEGSVSNKEVHWKLVVP